MAWRVGERRAASLSLDSLAYEAYSTSAMTPSSKIPHKIHTLGEAIRHLREAKGVSLRLLGKKVGVSAPFLSDLERNRRATDKLPEIAQALDVPLAELERFDTRVSADLREWITSRPGVSALLRELRDSGMDPYRARITLFRKK